MDKTRGLARNAGDNNEIILNAIAKIANKTVAKLAEDNIDILHTPSNLQELNENTSLLSGIIAQKLKNKLIKN